jgi:hypothetical protein
MRMQSRAVFILLTYHVLLSRLNKFNSKHLLRASFAHLGNPSLPGCTLPGDISASKRYWEGDVIDPPVEVSPRGTIPVPTSYGLGYHVRHDLIERWTVEKETSRAT